MKRNAFFQIAFDRFAGG